MTDRRLLAGLTATLMAIAVTICAVAIDALTSVQLDAQTAALRQAVRRQATLLQTPSLQPPEQPLPSTEIAVELARLLGPHGAMTLGRADGSSLVTVDNPWLSQSAALEGWSPEGDLRTAMQRAIAGEDGVMVVEGERTGSRIAAFTPVPGTGLGVVAHADLAALRAPWVRTATLVSGLALVLILGSGVAFFLISRPLLQRLRDGEHQLAELSEHMRSGAIVLRACEGGSDFVVTRLNRAAESIEGVARQEVIGRTASTALPGVRNSRLFDALRRVLRTGQPEHVPAAMYATSQHSGWREYHLFRQSTGEVVALFDDVSERRRAEEALKDSEARWKAVIDANAQAIVIVDPNLEIRFVNKAAETLFGQAAQELIGAPFGFPLVQGDVAEIEIIRPGRSITYGEMRALPIRWNAEDSFLLFIQDVSAHKRAEGDLRKLFQAIEQSPASVMITDVEGRIEYVNPKFTETTGYTYPEVVGKTPAFLKSGFTSPREYDELWKKISAGQVWRGEFNNRRKNGDLFWELASIAPVRDARGKVTHYVAVKEDISERKATEERLRHSQRMETIGQLTGGIAHDFNNLLAIILGNLQLLEEKRGLDRESRELIGDAVWSAERGAQLTHRLLAFARRQRLNPKTTDLNMIVAEMAGLLRRTLGERISVREILAPGVWPALIDRGQLESALLNLVVNARDAMPNGGVLTIATAPVVLPRDLATVGEDVVPGEYVALSVTDTGFGMPPEVVERIFEPFFTTKKFGEGSGLGLSMVYGFVRQSGGHIAVESEVGRGTTMRLYLPRGAADGDADDGRPKTLPEKRHSGCEVILVVEDDSRVRKTATNILRKQGYEVVEASDAGEALRAVDRMPRLDLLFADVVLANGINGSELAHQVLCRRPEARILLTSGYAAQSPLVDGLLSGGIDLLPKPYRRSELAARIRELLDRPTS